MKKNKKILFLFVIITNIVLFCFSIFNSSVLADYEETDNIEEYGYNIFGEKEIPLKDDKEETEEDEELDFIERVLNGINIPASYDLRSSNPYGLEQHGDININVENQDKEGLCWAFSSLGSLRTHLALKGIQVDPKVNSKTTANFSEWHMNYLTSKLYPEKFGSTRDYSNTDSDSKMSGNFAIATYYFSLNDGPILESELPYQTQIDVNNASVLKELDEKEPVAYVHKTTAFPTITKVRKDSDVDYYTANGKETTPARVKKDVRNKVKVHIMQNGGVCATVRVTSNNFNGNNIGGNYRTQDDKWNRYDDGTNTNETNGKTIGLHGITIVGWDDNYPKEKFHCRSSNGEIVSPHYNGAYLILNSYGEDKFENGYQWVSYEDAYIEKSIRGIESADTTEKYYTYKFTNQNLYNYFKDTINYSEGLVGDIQLYDSTNTIKCLDLVLNNFDSAYFENCGFSDAEIEECSQNKLIYLKELYLNGNKIENVERILTQFPNLEKLELKNQTINKNVKSNVNSVNYPDIFVKAKQPGGLIYSGDDFTFVGCKENSTHTGVELTSNNASITINSGNAAGTVMNITRELPVLTSISIKKLPQKTSYFVGDNLNLTGLVLEGKNNNGSTFEITSDYTANVQKLNTVGKQTITITYKGKTTSFDVTVSAVLLSSIRITNAPNKTEYNEGENFDKTGMKVIATYNNGSQKEIQNYQIEDGDNLKPQQEYVTISYTEQNITKTLNQKIKVNEVIKEKMGDVTGNNIVDINDCMAILRHIAAQNDSTKQKWILSEQKQKVADVTGEGKIDINDVFKLKRYIAATNDPNVARLHSSWLNI